MNRYLIFRNCLEDICLEKVIHIYGLDELEELADKNTFERLPVSNLWQKIIKEKYENSINAYFVEFVEPTIDFTLPNEY